MLASVAAAALAAALGATTYTVDPGASAVRFHLHHKMHAVDASTSRIEGKALVREDGKVQVMVRVPVASFDSGDGNRDTHMRETLESARFPFVVYKAVTSLVLPAASGKPVDVRLDGELDFHGVKRPLALPARITFEKDGSALVRSRFEVNLEAHGIERPALLFVKVDENVQLEVELRLRPG